MTPRPHEHTTRLHSTSADHILTFPQYINMKACRGPLLPPPVSRAASLSLGGHTTLTGPGRHLGDSISHLLSTTWPDTYTHTHYRTPFSGSAVGLTTSHFSHSLAGGTPLCDELHCLSVPHTGGWTRGGALSPNAHTILYCWGMPRSLYHLALWLALPHASLPPHTHHTPLSFLHTSPPAEHHTLSLHMTFTEAISLSVVVAFSERCLWASTVPSLTVEIPLPTGAEGGACLVPVVPRIYRFYTPQFDLSTLLPHVPSLHTPACGTLHTSASTHLIIGGRHCGVLPALGYHLILPLRHRYYLAGTSSLPRYPYLSRIVHTLRASVLTNISYTAPLSHRVSV